MNVSYECDFNDSDFFIVIVQIMHVSEVRIISLCETFVIPD